MPDFLTRFAPSPTGHLHLGHVASAHHVWAAARAANGSVILRIEDIDVTRCKREYEASILEDLRWLGFEWQGAIRRQSDHFPDFEAVLESLVSRGLAYRCFRTRREIAAALPAGKSPADAPFFGRPLPASDEQERLKRGHPFAWRLSQSAAKSLLGRKYDALSFQEKTTKSTRVIPADPFGFGDIVIARKDVPTSYHIACCHDDALQGITHVIRGEDLRAVTAIHVLLQALMDWPTPIYQFHPLVLDDKGRKLSKRAGDIPLSQYRKEGMTPKQILSMALGG